MTVSFLRDKKKPAELVVMDIGEDPIKKCAKKHAADVAEGKVRCLLGDSKALLRELPEATYDLIYVDGNHEYAGVCADLEAARTKLKPGGLMVLNDYYLFEHQFLARVPPRKIRYGVYGVIHAANEFALRYQWQVAYITTHPENMPDLALRRPLTG